MSRAPTLFLAEVRDNYIRQNFIKLRDFLGTISLFSGFKLFTATFTEAQTGVEFNHSLGFFPKDVIICSKTGTGVATFNQDKTTSQMLVLDVTGPCEIRFIAGTFEV